MWIVKRWYYFQETYIQCVINLYLRKDKYMIIDLTFTQPYTTVIFPRGAEHTRINYYLFWQVPQDIPISLYKYNRTCSNGPSRARNMLKRKRRM